MSEQVTSYPLFDVLSTIDRVHKYGLDTGDIVDQQETLVATLSYLPTNVVFLLGGYPDLRFVIAGEGAVRAHGAGDSVLVESRLPGVVSDDWLGVLRILLEMEIPCRWDAVSAEWVPVRLGGL